MKKLFTLILACCLLIMTIAGCSSTTAPDESPKGSEPASGLTSDADANKGADDDQGKAPEQVELIIESWRPDDINAWENYIIPAFEKNNPDIRVIFNPVINTEYTTTLQTKLSAGEAGDLIMVEPYDMRINLYTDGYIANLGDIDGVNSNNFEEFALSAWSTDDGDIFGVPLASALHGFIYNKTIFDELGLSEPETVDEFFALLEAVKEDGKYTPLAMGTGSDFVAGVMGASLVLPAFTGGEEGRLGIINGEKKFTDPDFVEAWEFMNGWVPYMPDGFEALQYSDLQNLFIMGQAAVYPAGSWEIPIFNDQIGGSFEYGAFSVPVRQAGDKGYINNHPDMGMALNAQSKHPEQAQRLISWMTSQEFADIWNEAMPGLYNLTTHDAQINDPLANTFKAWTETHGSSPRLAYQYISRGEPNTDAEIIRLTNMMFGGGISPQELCEQLQEGLESWYVPQ